MAVNLGVVTWQREKIVVEYVLERGLEWRVGQGEKVSFIGMVFIR